MRRAAWIWNPRRGGVSTVGCSAMAYELQRGTQPLKVIEEIEILARRGNKNKLAMGQKGVLRALIVLLLSRKLDQTHTQVKRRCLELITLLCWQCQPNLQSAIKHGAMQALLQLLPDNAQGGPLLLPILKAMRVLTQQPVGSTALLGGKGLRPLLEVLNGWKSLGASVAAESAWTLCNMGSNSAEAIQESRDKTISTLCSALENQSCIVGAGSSSAPSTPTARHWELTEAICSTLDIFTKLDELSRILTKSMGGVRECLKIWGHGSLGEPCEIYAQNEVVDTSKWMQWQNSLNAGLGQITSPRRLGELDKVPDEVAERIGCIVDQCWQSNTSADFTSHDIAWIGQILLIYTSSSAQLNGSASVSLPLLTPILLIIASSHTDNGKQQALDMRQPLTHPLSFLTYIATRALHQMLVQSPISVNRLAQVDTLLPGIRALVYALVPTRCHPYNEQQGSFTRLVAAATNITNHISSRSNASSSAGQGKGKVQQLQVAVGDQLVACLGGAVGVARRECDVRDLVIQIDTMFVQDKMQWKVLTGVVEIVAQVVMNDQSVVDCVCSDEPLCVLVALLVVAGREAQKEMENDNQGHNGGIGFWQPFSMNGGTQEKRPRSTNTLSDVLHIISTVVQNVNTHSKLRYSNVDKVLLEMKHAPLPPDCLGYVQYCLNQMGYKSS